MKNERDRRDVEIRMGHFWRSSSKEKGKHEGVAGGSGKDGENFRGMGKS